MGLFLIYFFSHKYLTDLFRLTDVVKNLLILNVLLFVADQFFDLSILALYYPGSENFQPFQLVTHFFMHGNFPHLLFNMFALVMFGSTLETIWGPRRFLFFYLFCALGAAVFQIGVDFWEVNQLEQIMVSFADAPTYSKFSKFFDKVPLHNQSIDYREYIQQLGYAMNEGNNEAVRLIQKSMGEFTDMAKNGGMLGASGAIFGLLMAFGLLFPDNKVGILFLPISLPAKVFIPLMMIAELYLSRLNFEWDNIAHYAHLGGAVFGALLILYWHQKGNDCINFFNVLLLHVSAVGC